MAFFTPCYTSPAERQLERSIERYFERYFERSVAAALGAAEGMALRVALGAALRAVSGSALPMLRGVFLWVVFAVALLFLCASHPAHASSAWAQGINTSSAEVQGLRTALVDDTIELNANLNIRLAPELEQAALRGIALHFVAETEIKRSRWYWYDKSAAKAQRYLRLSYSPLTQKWRLNASSDKNSIGLARQFDTYKEALSALQRINRWRIAGVQDLELDAKNELEFRFKLDTTPLSRPLQVGALTQDAWQLSLVFKQRLVVDLIPK